MSYPFNMKMSLNQLTIEPKGQDDKPIPIDLTPYVGDIAENVSVDLAQPQLNKQNGYCSFDDCKPTVQVKFAVDTIIGDKSWQNTDDKTIIWDYATNRGSITALLRSGLTIIKTTKVHNPDSTATTSINLNKYVERTATRININIDTITDLGGTVYIPQKHLFTVTAEFKPKRLTIGTVEPYTYNNK